MKNYLIAALLLLSGCAGSEDRQTLNELTGGLIPAGECRSGNTQVHFKWESEPCDPPPASTGDNSAAWAALALYGYGSGYSQPYQPAPQPYQPAPLFPPGYTPPIHCSGYGNSITCY